MGEQREIIFIKDNIARDDDSICGEVEITISFVVGRIAEENTFGGTR